MQRKSYTREFKIRAVQLMGENSKPICRLAEELGVSENNLYNWRKQFREKADNAFSNQPRLDEKELEIRQLKDRGPDHEKSPKTLKRSTEVKESFRYMLFLYAALFYQHLPGPVFKLFPV